MKRFSDLVGRTLRGVARLSGGDYDVIVLLLESGEQWKLHHPPSAAQVLIDEIIGDLNCVVGAPITLADEYCSNGHANGLEPKHAGDPSFTWTWFRLATADGFVTIRWYGASNGYYSEAVAFEPVHWSHHARRLSVHDPQLGDLGDL